MNQSQPKTLILAGDGINCESETSFACELAGFRAKTIHVYDLLDSSNSLSDADMLVFPGGFSFGDEIASGRVLALKLMEKLKKELASHISKGKLVIGICNGFQALVQMGLLPDSTENARRTVSLVHNRDGKFINRWAALEVPAASAKGGGYFEGITELELPIRHGEGRLIAANGEEGLASSRCTLRYKEDVNGSLERIAALADEHGRVMGMMPHPEAFVRWSQHPAWTKNKSNRDNSESCPPGLKIFKNALKMAQQS